MEPAYLSTPRLPGGPYHANAHDNALAWLKHIENHQLEDWIALPQDAVFSMAPACLDEKVPLPQKSRIIALLAAQIHPEAIAWLNRLSLQVEPSLRPLAARNA